MSACRICECGLPYEADSLAVAAEGRVKAYQDYPLATDAEREWHARGFDEGVASCATGPWIDGPPPEQEGLEVVVEDTGGLLSAGKWAKVNAGADSGRWKVQYGPWIERIVRHAIVNPPKEQP